MKRKCRGCGKPTTKLYIIADNLEEPKPYHEKCFDNLMVECLLKMADTGEILRLPN